MLEQRRGAVAVDWDHRFAPGSNVTPLFGDFTKIEAHHVGPIDLLVGGTPCQAFSIAGKRLGLDDPRGNLTLEFLALAGRLRPRWVVWENVPGVLSDDKGRTMGTVVGIMGQLGYRWAYRVLDAQFVRVDGFGRAVPQRRRRVFLVGHLGDDARSAAVLFDPESLCGHPAPRRQAGEEIAPTISARTRGGGGLGTDFDCDGGLIAGTVSSKWAKGTGGPAGNECQNLVVHALRADGFDASEDGTGRGTPIVPVALPSDAPHPPAIAIQERAVSENPDAGPQGRGWQVEVAFPANLSGTQCASTTDLSPALCAKNPTAVALYQPDRARWAVRRLTPRECERLQGFDDDFTLVEWRKKAAADGPRYKAIGNSMAVNVMRWIGQRIELVERAVGDRP